MSLPTISEKTCKKLAIRVIFWHNFLQSITDRLEKTPFFVYKTFSAGVGWILVKRRAHHGHFSAVKENLGFFLTIDADVANLFQQVFLPILGATKEMKHLILCKFSLPSIISIASKTFFNLRIIIQLPNVIFVSTHGNSVQRTSDPWKLVIRSKLVLWAPANGRATRVEMYSPQSSASDASRLQELYVRLFFVCCCFLQKKRRGGRFLKRCPL